MSLAILIDSLSHDLSRNLPRNTQSFLWARARHPELAPFPTIAALVDALRSSSKLPATIRRAVIAALVQEAQLPAPSFAPGVLVLAFAPMLHRLRRRCGTTLPNDDLDSTILLAFMTAIHAVPPGPYASLALRWVTQRTVLTARRAERGVVRAAPFDEEIHSPSPVHREHAREILFDVLRSLEHAGSAEALDVFIATRGENESLRNYIARTCPDVSQRRSRYQQLYRARRKFERALRKDLTRRAPRPVRARDRHALPDTED
jgi:hypothetical protein